MSFSPVVLSFIVSLAIVASTTLAYPNNNQGQTRSELTPIDDVSKMKDLPKGAELIPITQIRSVRYSLGKGVSNQRLVYQGQNMATYNPSRSVQLRVEYPVNGSGANVTYIEVDVNQNSDDGRAYVLSGGIGEPRIVFIVEAYNTTSFITNVKIYTV